MVGRFVTRTFFFVGGNDSNVSKRGTGQLVERFTISERIPIVAAAW